MLHHHWTRAKARIMYVAAAVVLYVPYHLLVVHR
jgi:hypothetical protein